MEPPISASVPITMISARLRWPCAASAPAAANVISDEIGMQQASTNAKMISAR